MATNREHAKGSPLEVVPTAGHGEAVKSGDPVMFGPLPAVALTDADADGSCAVQLDGVFRLEVDATSEMSPGDVVYFDDEALTDNADAAPFGVVLDPVGTSDPETVRVVLAQLGGSPVVQS